MAKDRTRHARIREPKQKSQADIIVMETGQVIGRISEDAVALIDGFDTFAEELTNFFKALNGEN